MQNYDAESKMNCSIHEIEEMYQNESINCLFHKKDGSGSKAYVFFSLETNLREGGFEEILDHVYIDEHFIENEDILVIIIKEELNDTMQETIRKKQKFEWLKNNRLIIIFSLPRLQINILKHEMVPKHIIIKEVDDVKLQFNIVDDSKFPEISRFDPVAQSIFMKPGQVCRIERMSKTAISTNYYRCCLNL
jgi:DNA-directed RNA polymerase subunit H (RpoH/RPB5)